MQDEPSARLDELWPGLSLVRAGYLTAGLVRRGDRALVVDPGAAGVPEAAGARVVWALATHYHRDTCSGLARCHDAGARIAVPASERDLVERVEARWTHPTVQFHRYEFRTGTTMLCRSVRVDLALDDGVALDWAEGSTITAVGTPGHTDGGLSYVLDAGGVRVAFVGDLVCGDGQFWELWSLQGPLPDDPVGSLDYHAWCGRARQSIRSLERLLAGYTPDVLIPAHGGPIERPREALARLHDRTERLLANYFSTSALRWYFPEWTARQAPTGAADPIPGALVDAPAWLRVGPKTTRAIVAPSGHAIVCDCWSQDVAETIAGWLVDGSVAKVDAIWISHYHDDHVGGIPELARLTGCEVWAHEAVAGIVQNPSAYAMPCLDPTPVKLDRVLREGERVDWEGFRLTAHDFPGQTLYHSALLVERDGARLLVGGDAFTPTGIDDYCAQNRNLVAPGRGYMKCLDLLDRLDPVPLVNMHVERPFTLPKLFRDRIASALRERRDILAALVPWPDPNFGLDPQWVACFPYQQRVAPGAVAWVHVRITNHAAAPIGITAALEVPESWWATGRAGRRVAAARSGSVWLACTVPADCPAGRYPLAVRISLDGRDLGQWTESLVEVAAPNR